jgi:hypothetical protein
MVLGLNKKDGHSRWIIEKWPFLFEIILPLFEGIILFFRLPYFISFFQIEHVGS